MNNKLAFGLFVVVFIGVSYAQPKTSLAIERIWKFEGDTIGINGFKTFKGYNYISTSTASDVQFENYDDRTTSIFKIPESIKTGLSNINLQKFLASNFTERWSKVIGGLGSDVVNDFALNEFGDAIIAGKFQNLLQLGNFYIGSGQGNLASGFIAFVNGGDGEIKWGEPIYGFSDYTSVIYHEYDKTLVAVGWHIGTLTVLGSKIEVAAQYLIPSIDKDTFVVKYSTSGELLWAKSLTGNGDQVINKVIDNGGDIYVIGTFEKEIKSDDKVLYNSNGDKDVFVAKYGNEGVLVWLKQFGSKSDDTAGTIFFQNDKLYISFTINDILALTFNSTTHTLKPGVVLLEIDTAGLPVWVRNMEGEVQTNEMVFDATKYFLLSGTFLKNVTFQSVKLDGCKSEHGCFYLATFDLNGGLVQFVNLFSMTSTTSLLETHITIDGKTTYLTISHNGEVVITPSEKFGSLAKLNSTVLNSVLHNAISHIISLKDENVAAPVITNMTDLTKIVNQFSDLRLPIEFTSNPFPVVEWFKDGKLLANQTTIPLLIKKVTESDAGKYIVKLTNSQGTVQSSPIDVQVSAVPPSVVLPEKKYLFGQVDHSRLFDVNIDYVDDKSNVKLTVKSNDSEILDESSYSVLGKKDKRAITIFPSGKSGNVELEIETTDGSLTNTTNMTLFIYDAKAKTPNLDKECEDKKMAVLDYVYFIGGGIVGVMLIEVIAIVVMKSYYSNRNMHLSVCHVEDRSSSRTTSTPTSNSRKTQRENYGTVNAELSPTNGV